jgi:LysR family transcriptional regulator, low CO2-responsive transcriptional regulator
MSLRHATLRQLRVFEAVARQLSFSRAAAELHLTQPAVSMQVKQLEAQAGLALFERLGKKIFLTEAGEELHQHSRVIAQQLRDADEALAARKGLSQGRLVITMVSTAKYLVPPLLARFLKQHPGVTVKLSANNREVVLKQLAENEVDLAIMGRLPEGMEAVAEPFARHPHVIIAAPDHPLAKKRRIALARLAKETFLIREPGSGTRGLLERLFAEHRLPLNVSMEMASNETIKQAVQAGMGISLLSLHTIELELKARRLAVLDVQGLPIVRDWHVVHLAAKRLSPVAQAFRDFLLSTAGKLVPEK